MCATSFSVVQNTTLGPSPPGKRRSERRKSYPSIFGMFQSRRMASGSLLRQASSACSPSSASTIWKSSPSRILRATLRMTLESSTTKQVFIVQPRCVRVPFLHHQAASRGGPLHCDVEHAVNIEHHQKLSFEPINSGRDTCQPRIEIGRIWLARHIVQLEHLANAVDQQSVGLPARFHANRHGLALARAILQPEPPTHIDQGHDATA